jgi:hypothetical protein
MIACVISYFGAYYSTHALSTAFAELQFHSQHTTTHASAAHVTLPSSLRRVMFLPSLLRQPDTTDGFSCDPNDPLTQFRLHYGGLTNSNSKSSVSTLPAALLPVPYTVPPAAYQQGDVPWSHSAHKPGVDSTGLTWQGALEQLVAIKHQETGTVDSSESTSTTASTTAAQEVAGES